MYRKALVYILGLGLAISLLVAVLAGRDGDEPQRQAVAATVSKRDFTVQVHAMGDLDAAHSTVLFSQVRSNRGKIVSLVSDGTRVKKGDVLVRLDPTPFEEKVHELNALLQESRAQAEANRQMLEWEKIQAEREIKAASFDVRAAELDLVKLQKGDGPLEMARLQKAAQEAKAACEEKKGYFKDLQKLARQGYANEMEISQAKKQVAEAQDKYETAKRQWDSYRKHVFPALVEKAQAGLARSRMLLEQSRRAMGFRIGKAAASLRKAEQSVENVAAKLQAAKNELANTVIKAPIPGIVVLNEAFRGGSKRKPRIGDVVWQNQALVYLPDISKMVVKTKIREIDLHKVAAGTPAEIRVDAYPNLRLSGKVSSIGVLAESDADDAAQEKFFKVELTVSNTNGLLRPGMTVRVTMNCAEVHNQLAVPLHAVFMEDGCAWCFVDIKASYEKREVRLGPQSEDWVQVVSGLRENEEVALFHPAAKEVKAVSPLAALEKPR
jgi:HlyD family secretion protein